MCNHCKPVMLRICIAMLVYFAWSGASFAADRIELDQTSIIGTHELPKVLYIVPWKESNVSNLSAQAEGIQDEGMTPIDRDTYTREVQYFDMLRGDAGIGGALTP